MVWEIGLPLPFAASVPEHQNETELAEACRRGNVRAFEHLYHVHSARMKSLAFHLLGSRADAEDTVQEAFLKVCRAARGFEGNSALSTWIYRILINCCYDAIRKRQRLAENPLNERQRMVFLLFEVEGLRHSEIAAILEVPEGTSRSWLFEAKCQLKRMLTEAPK
jgi:RNA polymerase sigma-70 factor (ECF subfamily)